jgi:hypothetical protein
MSLRVGQMYFYKLTAAEAALVNQRRQDAADFAKSNPSSKQGLQSHAGNLAASGDVCPIMITKMKHTPGKPTTVNGQVFLDGNDVLFVSNVPFGARDIHGHAWDYDEPYHNK